MLLLSRVRGLRTCVQKRITNIQYNTAIRCRCRCTAHVTHGRRQRQTDNEVVGHIRNEKRETEGGVPLHMHTYTHTYTPISDSGTSSASSLTDPPSPLPPSHGPHRHRHRHPRAILHPSPHAPAPPPVPQERAHQWHPAANIWHTDCVGRAAPLRLGQRATHGMR